MPHATLDRLLALLVIALAITGVLSLRAGAPSSAWLFVVHGVLAGSLLGAVALKLNRSVPGAIRAGRFRRLALGLTVSLAVIAALTGGYAWVVSGEVLTIGSWTVLTLHIWVGLVLVPLVVVHLLPHRWRLLRPFTRPVTSAARPRLSRRSALAAGTLAVGGVALYGLASVVERVRGGERRFTGSRWLPTGGIPPVTTFYGEGPPPIDPDAWRLMVRGPDPRAIATWRLAELRALGEVDLTAILDCTSGWALETGWRGVPLATVLEAAGVTLPGDSPRARIVITSETGWGTALSADEASRAILATEVAGQALPLGNGAPCRLVVPDRRGLDWVKWVSDIRVI
jgi:DMSO/TMAO reductase YedYZ molybdopterin-dependent catalytic subunit